MTSPNPMALEAKALEAAREKTRLHSFSCLTRDEHDDLVSAAIRAYLAALPLPAAGEGLEPAGWQPARPAYQIKAMPNASQYIYTLFPTEAEARVQYGDGEVRPLYAATPAARAAVLPNGDPLDKVDIAARAIYDNGPGIGGDTENGWDAQSDNYKFRCRAIAHVVIAAALKEKT